MAHKGRMRKFVSQADSGAKKIFPFHSCVNLSNAYHFFKPWCSHLQNGTRKTYLGATSDDSMREECLKNSRYLQLRAPILTIWQAQL